MLTLRVDFAGEAQYVRAFQIAQQAAQDLREPLEQVADLIRENAGEQFRTEGAHSAAWPQLSPGYREWKDWNYPGRPILVREGKLRQAFLVSPDVKVGPRRLVWQPDPDARYDDGTPVGRVADAHQAGEGRLPQRKILNLTSQDRRDFDRVFVDWAAHLGRRITRVTG